MRLMAVIAALVVLVPMAGVGIAASAQTTVADQLMQIVAHEDDDLLFMNPDIHDSIRSGMPSVTVFITAGQITGLGNTDEERARNRQRGIQDAYARMAAVPDVDPEDQEEWNRDAWTLAGKQVERYTLTAAPQVSLVFMNLRDNELGWFVVVDEFEDHTIIPEGSLVTQSYTYDHQDVVAVLTGIMQHYQPSVLRAMDPMPDNRYNPGHGDHVGAAMFAGEAATSYGVPIIEQNYRDYNISDVPVNLSGPTVTRKTTILQSYFHYDPFDPDGWESRMYYRWARGTAWAGRNADGTPQIFVVRSGAVSTYRQTPAGLWSGPLVLGGAGGPLKPAISVGLNADGRMQIFARRQSDHHLVTLAQTTPGGGWDAGWSDLGNPGTGDPEHIGVPAVAANANGRLQIFVKNGAGGVSARTQSAANGSTWGSWTNLNGGGDVQDGLTAVTNPQGRIELFASTRTRILRWYQSAPNGGYTLDNALPSMTPASPPTAALAQNGRIEVAYRRAGTADLVVTRQSAAGGAWNVSPVVIGGHAGVGDPELVTTPAGPDARILMFHRNADAGVSLATQTAPNAGYGSWSDLGGAITDYPAAVLDQSGAVVLFAVGTDGKVHLRKQTAPGADSPFGPWETLP
ncbi:GlcNAc-PI de-N-acetylase [Nonomuraea solani]|uniref:GlcNAc-PI de-N-acetylase n=1 Tax=Nonomuraea solani TaxID=1144553 RepID=A0A1H6CLH0_9ACTN|nr:PIG-L family deacetylase [Nonomuraea solani]SEG73810.1 GlcNAc-PI de-N-acetylase [Nonomuraea solani]